MRLYSGIPLSEKPCVKFAFKLEIPPFPFLVVIISTPFAALAPYNAEEVASLSKDTLSISLALMSPIAPS